MRCAQRKTAQLRALPYRITKHVAKSHKQAQKKVDKKKANTPLTNLMRSEFARVEAAPPPSALGNLTNPILSIFRPANFPDVEDYDVIAPSACLASLLLQHASIRPMLRTILTHGPLIPLGEVDDDDPDSPKELCAYPPDLKPVTRRAVKSIEDFLEELADFVVFRADPGLPLGSATTTAVHKTQPPKTHARYLPGISSVVTYSTAIQGILTSASETRGKHADIPLLLAYRFSFAVELAHEVCHALTFARDGHSRDIDTDPFFPGARVAEHGFAIEEALFGGHFNMIWDEPGTPIEKQMKGKGKADPFKFHRKSTHASSDLLGIPVLWSWPCRWIAKDYRHNCCGMWLRREDWARLPRKDIAWRVPIGDLARFFRMEFWAEKEPDVMLRREVGFAFSSNEVGQKRPCHVFEKESGLYVPEGFEVSGSGAIVKCGNGQWYKAESWRFQRCLSLVQFEHRRGEL